MDGRDVTLGIEEVVTFQFIVGCFASIAYKNVGKDDVGDRGLNKVLIIYIEVDAQLLGGEYPNLAVVGMSAQVGQCFAAICYPLFIFHPCKTVGDVEVLAWSGVDGGSYGIASRVERLDDILQQ